MALLLTALAVTLAFAPALNAATQGPELPLRHDGVTLAVRARPGWFEIEVLAVEGNPESVNFLDGHLEGAWCLPLNYRTRVAALPASGRLDATAFSRTGIVGARVAVIPRQDDMRQTLAAVVAASDLWKNSYGGPGALDHRPNFESYLMTLPEAVTRANVDAWIALCRRAKITQLDWVHAFRYGDYSPKSNLYPRGWDDVSYVTSRLRQAGIQSILHTYSMAIAQGSPLYSAPGTVRGPDQYRLPSTLEMLDAIAGNLAEAVNRGGFDGIYFDALDWANHIEGRQWGWYWAGRFVHETGKHLRKKDMIVETAMFGAAMWQVASRFGALDYPGDNWRNFVNHHAARLHPEFLLAGEMGWLPIDGTDDPADIDYALETAADAHAGISWRGLTPRGYAAGQWQRAAAERLGQRRLPK